MTFLNLINTSLNHPIWEVIVQYSHGKWHLSALMLSFSVEINRFALLRPSGSEAGVKKKKKGQERKQKRKKFAGNVLELILQRRKHFVRKTNRKNHDSDKTPSLIRFIRSQCFVNHMGMDVA